jgi:hypothetical protein
MRARDLAGQGPPTEAACRIVILEDRLEEALRLNAVSGRSWTQALMISGRTVGTSGGRAR